MLLAGEPSALEMDPAEEPEHKEDNQDQAQGASKTGSAITPIAVVAAAAAEQHDDHHNNQN